MPAKRRNEALAAPKKHLGQHFLAASSYARRVAYAVPAQPDEHVLEIGPGRGAVSVFLKERFAGFHMVEVDAQVLPLLKSILGPGSWALHHADALEFDFSQAGFPLHLVGNLPYLAAARIIHKSLRYGNNILSCTFMVQREVAERITAKPHGRKIGYLSIFCQFFGTPRILFHVPPGAFVPPPSIDSSVFQILIDPGLEERLARDRWDDFFLFVSAAFCLRRKKLPNALSSIVDRTVLAEVLTKENIGLNSRPEDLCVAEWLRIYRKVKAV